MSAPKHPSSAAGRLAGVSAGGHYAFMQNAANPFVDARQGIVDFVPILVAVIPVGALFGTLAVGAGLSTAEAMLMSLTMYAGASQMVAIELWGTAVPVWSILLSVFAVNFRHLLYSAGMVRILAREGPLTRALTFFFLVDPAYALAAKREAAGYKFTCAYYFAPAILCYAVWAIATFLGAAFGQLIEEPRALAIDMILPIFFLSQLLAFRARPRWGVVVTASAVVSTLVYHAPALGIAWLGSPWHISLGAAAGIFVAVIGPQSPHKAAGKPRVKRWPFSRSDRPRTTHMQPDAAS